MNIEELKESWNELHHHGLNQHDPNDIQRIIDFGTTKSVAQMNRKIMRDILITAFAAMVSALGILFFYFFYDPIKFPEIDLSKIVPIQFLGLVIFLVLFLFGWIEYKLINKKFTSATVKSYLSGFLNAFQTYNKIFTTFVLLLLVCTFYIEIDLFIRHQDIVWLLIKGGITLLLTFVSFKVIKVYYEKSFSSHLKDLSSYLSELGD